jgi:hypothetical protein
LYLPTTEILTLSDPATTDCGRDTCTVSWALVPLFRLRRIGVLYSLGTPSGYRIGNKMNSKKYHNIGTVPKI